MKFINLAKLIASVAVLTVAFSSCEKAMEADEVTPADGRTIVKVLDGGTAAAQASKLLAIDFLPTPQTFGLADFRRDVPNTTELNKTVTITVKDDTMALRIYNDSIIAHGGDPVIPLPASWYTIGSATPKVGGDGGTYTVTFNPGEIAKQILITVPDATVLDPSSTYALAFTVVSANPETFISENRTIVIEIGAKNAYDGIYSYVSGSVIRYTGPNTPQGDALSGPLGPANPDVVMTTIGANTVLITGLTWSGGTSGVAGIDGLTATVDPTTNLVTMASQTNASLVNMPGQTNSYNPATKTFTLAFRWVSTSPAYREYKVVWKYKGPR
jgi:hypothetical protein